MTARPSLPPEHPLAALARLLDQQHAAPTEDLECATTLAELGTVRCRELAITCAQVLDAGDLLLVQAALRTSTAERLREIDEETRRAQMIMPRPW